ncbi:MAG TPA: DUF3459 domain-containing protein, partial [Acidobacteriaceae bacterium]|nr:DUF3459 domain-containing protein [Acidobacteriaceae bacterium]
DFGSLADLAKSLQKVFVYDGKYSSYRNRRHGRPAVGLPGHRFLGYVQNHDQIGNRARGERISQIVSLGRTKIAAAWVLTSPFLPMLFQGEEFGASTPFQYFTAFEEPEIGRLISEGRKKEFAAFGWNPDDIPDPQDKETFRRSKLNWQELSTAPHAEILQWYRELIRLRRTMRDLEDSDLSAVQVRFDEESGWLIMERGRIRVASNLGKNKVTLEVGDGAQLLLASDSSVILNQSQAELGPDSVALFQIPSAGR